MSSLLKTFVISVAAFSAVVMTTAPTFAKDVTAEEAKQRVNLAGRQRMLSQRIAMSACFATMGVDARENYERLDDAFKEFSLVHDGLRNGNEDLGLHQEGYRSVIDVLDGVDLVWTDYQEMVDGFMKIKLMTPDIMNRFDSKSLAVLNDMNIAVTTIASSYSADLEELPQILALTIDFAGRQRMLSQKIAKEFCLVSAGINADENRDLLIQSHEQFNMTLSALVDGIPHLITPAPTQEIKANLDAVEEAWVQPNLIIAKAIAGDDITRMDQQFISDNMEIILMRMNDTVTLYEDVDGLPNF